jgi:hypothetical protein
MFLDEQKIYGTWRTNEARGKMVISGRLGRNIQGTISDGGVDKGRVKES